MNENMISILDDNGIEHVYEVIDIFQVNGLEYAAIVGAEDESDGETLLLRIIREEDDAYLEPIQTEKEFNQVRDVFLTRNQDWFTEK